MRSLRSTFCRVAAMSADRVNFYRVLLWAIIILDDVQRREKERRRKRRRAAMQAPAVMPAPVPDRICAPAP